MADKLSTVSVIIPTHNPRLVGETIGSVFLGFIKGVEESAEE